MPASLGKRKRASAATLSSSKLLKVSKSTPVIPVPVPVSEPESSDSPSADNDEDDEQSDSDSEPLDPQEIFRRHFEAQFKPLPPPTKKSKPSPAIAENEKDDDWEGLSDNSAEYDDVEEGESGVQVVEHVKKVDSRIAGMSKGELRAFMSSKIPKSLPASSLSQTNLKDVPPGSAEDPGATEALNLKNDLALQRLLYESHLLTSSLLIPKRKLPFNPHPPRKKPPKSSRPSRTGIRRQNQYS